MRAVCVGGGQAPKNDRPRRVASGFVGPATTEHGALDGNGDERRKVFADWVAAKDHEVGEFAGGDGAFDFFLVGGMRAVERADTDRLLHSDALIRTPDVALG